MFFFFFGVYVCTCMCMGVFTHVQRLTSVSSSVALYLPFETISHQIWSSLTACWARAGASCLPLLLSSAVGLQACTLQRLAFRWVLSFELWSSHLCNEAFSWLRLLSSCLQHGYLMKSVSGILAQLYWVIGYFQLVFPSSCLSPFLSTTLSRLKYTDRVHVLPDLSPSFSHS